MAEKEYIEREAAIDCLMEILDKPHHAEFLYTDEVCGAINSIPAADARPVVLCRNCKRYVGRPWENNESGICTRTDVGVGKFDFCSYGEKKEES
jgi:hypothetical protein